MDYSRDPFRAGRRSPSPWLLAVGPALTPSDETRAGGIDLVSTGTV